MMRILLTFLSVLFYQVSVLEALEIKHNIRTSIGLFDACEETFSYAFFKNKDYDVKTSLYTTGIFGKMYPFKASYHSVGTYKNNTFFPQDYYYETQSRFRKRTKEIFYKNGIPQYRISTKDKKKRIDDIIVDNKYSSSIDLLSVFGLLAYNLNNYDDCNLTTYSFNGKRYTLSKIKMIGKERIKTDFFEGKAIKCEYSLEVSDDADAGFLLTKDVPIYFWVMKDKKNKAYFLAKILVEKTPFGKLEAITTNVEVIE